MHGRPLRGDDPESAVSALSGFTTRHWRQTRRILQRLAADVSWEPAFETLPLASERVLHNLPLADYDETGLVGRSDDVARLKSLLQKRREPIITITGEGGIGKTALALEVAYAVVDDAASDFDCVLWVSLKSEMLTPSGVRSIEDAIHGITGAAQQLGNAFDRSFAGSVEDLGDALRGLRALVVLDNLESAQGDEVIELYDKLPASVSYLFTSRIGVGQLERRVPLGPLRQKDAELLFRKLASARKLTQLLRLSPAAMAQVIERLRCSPLAIKWYVLSVEAGKEPLSTLRDQKQLIDFCIRNVYEMLSPRARAILSVLDAVDRSVAFDELAVLTELPIDDLRSAAQELGRGAMVVHEPDSHGGLVSRLSLSVAARLFLRTQPGRDSSMSHIHSKEEAYRRSAERRRANQASRSLAPNVVRARTPEDEPVVHLLDLALHHSRRGEWEQASSLIDRARALNPEYWEVDRVAGFVASTQKRGVEASAFYRSALAYAINDEERAVVAYFLAGHLARKMNDIDMAITFSRQAHETLDLPDTAMQLGNLLIWNRDFDNGQSLIEGALESASGRTYLIAATALVESWRRWSEMLIENRHISNAIEKAFSGFSVGMKVLEDGYVDLRLVSETVDSAAACLQAMASPGSEVDPRKTGKIVAWIEGNLELARAAHSWNHCSRALSQISRVATLEPANRQRILLLFPADGVSPNPDLSEVRTNLVGEVVSWAGRYGFIRHIDYPSNVFFHASACATEERSLLTRGGMVSFDVSVDEGRPRAEHVKLLEPSGRGAPSDVS